ncbi:SGNH/GDSL hydrolase family protein [Bacillus toyonensis]|uniref:SGNH hydrolase-type esterase domain-containing protein n=1 Tax=Bacillus toyonensis TaxID=155322 RepID=A0A2A8HBZ3_9BACI|nr:SGNH/GDSL hydrolase family protein [Bacillus toyonensis]PEQ01704.1 hypothetical protein CN585_20990 [Bacillus toyonensis]
MTIKDLGTNMDRQWRNDLNDNFRELSRYTDTATSALNKANTADQKANSALQQSTSAEQNANSAKLLSQNAKQQSQAAETKADFTQSQLDKVTGASTIDPAVSQMKIDTAGVTHNSPDARLRSDYNKLNTGLHEKTELNDFTNRAPRQFFTPKISIEKIGNPFGLKTQIILGDSISHGANAVDITNASYVGILRKMLNYEYDTDNFGFVSCVDKFTTPGGDQFNTHAIISNTGWTYNGASTSIAINGADYRAITDGSEIVYELPTLTSNFAINYRRYNGGGVFEVYMNDVLVHTQDTNSGSTSDTFYNITNTLTMQDNGFGKTRIKIKKISGGEVSISGVYYFNNRSDFQLFNFSQSGRAIHHLTQGIIDVACRCNSLIFALGHNDMHLTGADKQKTIDNLNYLIQQANLRKTKLIILDFAWNRGNAGYEYVTQELQRVHKEVPNSIYINFAQNVLMTEETTTATSLIDDYAFLNDGSHPAPKGHKIIAETIAKALGLSASSKNMAERTDKIWKPFALLNGWENGSKNKQYISAWRENGNEIQIRLYVKKPTDDAQYALPICKLPQKANISYSERIGFWELPTGSSVPKPFWLLLVYGTNTDLKLIKNTIDNVPSQSIIAIQFSYIPI